MSKLKEVWYNCSAHRYAHLFIIEVSSHTYKMEAATNNFSLV